jgi:hypothetical protein
MQMADFDSSGHDLAAPNTPIDERKLTIIYGTLGVMIACMSLIVTILSLIRSSWQRRGADQCDEASEDELQDMVARNDCEQYGHPAFDQRNLGQLGQKYNNAKLEIIPEDTDLPQVPTSKQHQ